MKVFFFLSSFCIIVGVAAMAQADVNILVNGGFEEGLASTGIPLKYYSYIPNGTATFKLENGQTKQEFGELQPVGNAFFELDSTQVYEGKKSLKIETDGNVTAIIASDPIPCAPGEKIKLRVWCRTEKTVPTSSGKLAFCAGFKNRNRQHFEWSKPEKMETRDGEWMPLELSTTVPQRAAFVVFEVGLDNMHGKTWWDKGEVIADTPVAAYFDMKSDLCEPGENSLFLILINHDPSLAGKEVTLLTEPGGSAQKIKLTDQAATPVEATFVFSKRGKQICKAKIVDPSSGMQFFIAQKSVEIPALIRMEPVVPTHSCVEDGSPEFEGRLWIHEKPDIRKQLSIKGILKGPKGIAAQWSLANLPENPVRYHIKPTVANMGKYVLSMTVEKAGAKCAEATQDWNVITRSEAKVEISDKGYLLMNGKETFPIGMYNCSHFDEMASAGFNVTHSYNSMVTTPGTIPDNQKAKAFLDVSYKAGMKTLMLITHGSHARPVDDEFLWRVRMFRNHPGLLAWDEEEGVARGEAAITRPAEIYAACKKLAPEHPVMIGDTRNLIGKLPADRSDFFPVDSMDMGMWWWYPFPIRENVKGNALMGTVETNRPELAPPTFLVNAKTTKPLWVAVQAYRKAEDKEGRFPTPTEYRAQCYLSVIHGAKGVMFYVGYGEVGGTLLSKPDEANWEYVKSLVSELREMSPVFMSADSKLNISTVPVVDMISFRMKETENGLVLLASSRSLAPLDVSFSIKGVKDCTASVRFENRTVDVKDGKLKDRFEPMATHVYTFPQGGRAMQFGKVGIRLLVSDFDGCFRFYRDIMGFQAHWGGEGSTYASFTMTGGADFALFRRGLMAEALGTAHLPAKADSQDPITLVFGVENLDETVSQLKSKGIRFVSEPKDYPDWTIRAAYLRDPDGNLIELCSSLPRSQWTERVAAEERKYAK